MNEKEITSGAVVKNRSSLKIAVGAFAMVGALLLAPIVAAESASAASTSGYTTCSAGKRAGVKARVQGAIQFQILNQGISPVYLYNNFETLRAHGNLPTTGWTVIASRIQYAYNSCK